MYVEELSLWRLRIVADSDPGAVARVLERFKISMSCPGASSPSAPPTTLFIFKWTFSAFPKSSCASSLQKFANLRVLSTPTGIDSRSAGTRYHGEWLARSMPIVLG